MTLGYFRLVRTNRNFRNLWFGQIVSLFGDWFNLIASASLVGTLTGSGLAIGGLFVVRMLSPFLVSPLAGVAADRYNRRKLLLTTDLVRAVVVLGFLLVRTPEQIWLLYALTALQLAMHGVFFPTRNAILPDIVAPEDVGTANAITATTWSVMLAMGAAAGGLVAGGFGVYPAFIIDSLTFLLSAAFIFQMRYRPAERERRKASIGAALAEYVEGIRYLKAHRSVLAITFHKAALTLCIVGAYEVVQVSIASEVFVIGEGGGISLGLLYAAIGLGSGAGPLTARALVGDEVQPMRVTIFIAYLVMAVGLFVMAPLTSFPLALFGAFLRSFGGGTLWVFSTQLLLHFVPEHMRGRVFSTEYAFLTLGMATSAGIGGLLLDHHTLGQGDILRLMASVVLVPGVLWGLFLLRDRRTAAVETSSD